MSASQRSIDLALTDEQLLLQQSAQDFFADHGAPAKVRASLAAGAAPDRKIWSTVAELGWTAIPVPEEQGGLGLGLVELELLQEAAGASLLPTYLLPVAGLVIPAILHLAPAARHAALLAPLMAGDETATLALPVASDTATLRRGPGGLSLEGSLASVAYGDVADTLYVAARTEGAAGLSLVRLARETEGVEARREQGIELLRPQATLSFAAVKLAEDAVVGAVGAADAALEAIADQGAVLLAAECVGGAQRCLDMAVAYAKERVQFGRPIASYQAVKHLLADMAVRLEMARSGVRMAAHLVTGDREERVEAAAIAKSYAVEACYRVACDCIQTHGGAGFTWDNDSHLILRRCRTALNRFGTTAGHRKRVADLLWPLPGTAVAGAAE